MAYGGNPNHNTETVNNKGKSDIPVFRGVRSGNELLSYFGDELLRLKHAMKGVTDNKVAASYLGEYSRILIEVEIVKAKIKKLGGAPFSIPDKLLKLPNP